MKRAKRAKVWLTEHKNDPYVKEAQRQGYRSRAVFKLLAIQETDRIIRPGMIAVELGAAPGGWSQLLVRLIGKKGKVFAIDLLPMDEVRGVTFIQGDLLEEQDRAKLLDAIGENQVDLVVSDMAPNLSGIDEVDQSRVIELANLALTTAEELLKPGGNFIVKLFQGRGFAEYIKNAKRFFNEVVMRKPQASRARSNEVYLVAKGYKGKNVLN